VTKFDELAKEDVFLEGNYTLVEDFFMA